MKLGLHFSLHVLGHTWFFSLKKNLFIFGLTYAERVKSGMPMQTILHTILNMASMATHKQQSSVHYYYFYYIK